ncbi:MAG: hypothetical protein ACRENW_04440, partial [Thermodesulfobacteriota bacterium]
MGDHILKVVAERDGAVGSEIQDLCVLAAPNCAFFPGPFIDGTQCQDFSKDEGFIFTTQVGSAPLHAADAIFPFASCKASAQFQRAPQPTDPCAGLVEECPCNYNDVPMTTACWGTCPVCDGDPFLVGQMDPDGFCKLQQNLTTHPNQQPAA